ncbi:hypothetical protein GLOIN_2v1842500 [Rhizophagus clarus]|uniref:Uncharacterized protein n=1 Tax=Rhizophagus clarus TaxID=94130 RepID=A0A8H3LMF4_9GLOM|nr:hypothetical protein GLOIN_2v1842500 [Rhizophagus clarus]
MSALVLQNNALWHIFEDFTASILLSACFLIYVIRKQFTNNHPPTHDNKITNELSARMSKINAQVNTRIANELSARLSEVNSTFTMELVRNNNELNKKFTGEITKINSRDAGYVSDAQKILSIVNNMITRLDNIEEACHNDFGNISSEFILIKTSIEALRNEMIQLYHESSSSRLSDSSLEENRNHFKRVFDSNKEEGENLDYAFETVRRKIHQLTGEKIGKETVKNFYYGRGDPKFRIVMSIMRWVDSKEFNGSLDNNAE